MAGAIIADRAPHAGGAGRAGAKNWRWLAPVLAGWALVYGVMVALSLSLIANHEFRDPDDELRLQQVRDLLAGQSWFDLHNYRIDAYGGGVLMHWSRLIDAPIAALIALLRPLLGQGGAEHAALIAIPALTLLAIMALVGWLAARTLPRAAQGFALLALALAAPVMVQVLPLRIDHHGWQIALALLAMAGLHLPDARRGGWLTGGALAAWMAISFEGLPLSAWIVAMLALWTLYDMRERARLAATMQALAAVSAVLFLATRGLADPVNHCDAIAPVHLALFGWGALAITLPIALRPGSRPALIAGLAAAGAGALALIALAAPQCAGGSFDMLDPVVRSMWYDQVLEGKPVWRSSWSLVAQYALPPLLGLYAAIRLARGSQGDRRRWWALYAAVLAGALALGLAVSRASAISGALAALPLGWLFASWIAALRRPANPLLRLGELAGAALLIFAALLPIVPVLAVERLLSQGASDEAADEPGPTLACRTRAASAALAALPRGDILAPLDFGPDILLNSAMGVVATGHHRGAPAMRVVIDAFSGTPENARAIMRRRSLRYVMICPGAQEMKLYRERGPDGFAVRLLEGRAPPWLRPVPLPQAAGLQMWERME